MGECIGVVMESDINIIFVTLLLLSVTYGKVAGDPYTKTLYWSVLARVYIRAGNPKFQCFSELLSVLAVFESRNNFLLKYDFKNMTYSKKSVTCSKNSWNPLWVTDARKNVFLTGEPNGTVLETEIIDYRIPAQ